MRAARRLLGAVSGLIAIAVVAAAGTSWALSTGPRPVVVSWIRMVDERHGYALSRGPVVFRLLRTEDGGRYWTDITPSGGTIQWGSLGLASGSTVLLSTTLRPGVFAVGRSDDGGRTWHRSLPFTDKGGQVVGQAAGAPALLDTRRGYVAVDEGAAAGSQAQALYVTADGGQSWKFVSRTDVSGVRPLSLPFGCDKSGFGFATAKRGWASGYCPGGRPFFYRTDDGGRSWRPQPLPRLTKCACGVSAPRFFTPRVGAIGVTGFSQSGKPLARVYWTSDGGEHWRRSDPNAGRASGSISFANGRTAWLVSSSPTRINGRQDRLFRTSDGGRHWQTLPLPFEADGFELDALSATVAYAVNTAIDRKSILMTRNGGRNWQTIRTLSTAKAALRSRL